jgi:hypothetical protein
MILERDQDVLHYNHPTAQTISNKKEMYTWDLNFFFLD